MKIYFVRHGESVGNMEHIHQTGDMPLSETGKNQAKAIAERLKKFKIDRILASPILRTKETADIISAKINVPVEILEGLIEVKGPSELRGVSYDDPGIQKIKNAIRENYIKGSWKYSDEENYDEINIRAGDLLAHLLKAHKDEDIVCVSHATYIKFLIAKMLFGEDLTAKISHIFYHHLMINNTGLTVCEYEDKTGWIVRHINDASHL